MDFMEEYIQILGANQLQANPILINSKRKYVRLPTKSNHFFLYFIQEVLLVITYSVLSLTALSILYSLNTVSESSSQNGSSHGTSKINQEMNEHIVKVDFYLFLIPEALEKHNVLNKKY